MLGDLKGPVYAVIGKLMVHLVDRPQPSVPIPALWRLRQVEFQANLGYNS